jgi:hypothetical protein
MEEVDERPDFGAYAGNVLRYGAIELTSNAGPT